MPVRRPFAIALSIAVAGCATPAAPPPAAPVQRVAVPQPRAVPPALSSDWRDWPVTPGDWRYAREGIGSVARFGAPGAAPLLTLRCDGLTRQVSLARPVAMATPLTIRTSSTVRTVAVRPADAGYFAVALPAGDPLFDAMGFSRGHFVVELPGAATLVVPAWPEILRVAEDCRG